MKTYQQFIQERYYKPNELLPSGKTPQQKADQKTQSITDPKRQQLQQQRSEVDVPHDKTSKTLNTRSGVLDKKRGVEISGDPDDHMIMHDKKHGITFSSFKEKPGQYHVSFDTETPGTKTALRARTLGKDFLKRHPKQSTVTAYANNEKLKAIYTKHGFSGSNEISRTL